MASRTVFKQAEPPPPKRGGARRKYQPMLEQIVNNPKHHDKWILLVEFDSRTGARDAKHRLVTGESVAPDGDWEWRAAINPDNTSHLYTKYRSNK